MGNLSESLKIAKDKIKYNEPMSKHTTFKIGGLAEYFITIDKIEDLKEVLNVAKQTNMPLHILGNGSNLLVREEGIKGITLNIRLEKIEIKQENEKIQITVGAGEKLSKLAQICCKEQITGMEELSSIPGTIGGAIKMNAGAHGKEIKDLVKWVKCIDYDGKERTFSKEELKFGYRTSIFQKEPYIILETNLELGKGKQEEIKKKMEQYKNERKEKQPIEYPSAGSTFKRGTDFVTAKLIEEAGLKGLTVGDAMVSTKHSGFIINKGKATAKEVIELIEQVKSAIDKKFGKKIELEIEIWGE